MKLTHTRGPTGIVDRLGGHEADPGACIARQQVGRDRKASAGEFDSELQVLRVLPEAVAEERR